MEDEVNSASSSELDILEQPIAASEVTTDADGAFKIQFKIPWETLCTHPKGGPMAFFDPNCEHDFCVSAELMPPLPSPSSTPNMSTDPHPFPPPPHLMTPAPITKISERVPLTYSPVRVISDIDDTVKLSGVHTGARAVFHNVFVKELEENLIPGMGEWYSEMWCRGVRFHYVVSSQTLSPFVYPIAQNLCIHRSQMVPSNSFPSLLTSFNWPSCPLVQSACDPMGDVHFSATYFLHLQIESEMPSLRSYRHFHTRALFLLETRANRTLSSTPLSRATALIRSFASSSAT